MQIVVYGMMAAGLIVFAVNWWRIMKAGYQLQRIFASNRSASGGRGAVLTSRWRFFLTKAVYAFLGFAVILAGVLISKNG